MPFQFSRVWRSGLLAVVVAPLLAGAALAAEPGLTLKRVLLSTGGVGYFESEATVDGDADLTLDVRRDQVDDVMKSLVVYDDKGGVGAVSLPGREPLRDVFRELPFGVEALESPTALLTALRGSELRVTGPHELAGRLIAVTEEQAQSPHDGGVVTRHRLSLMTADGLRQTILEDVEALRLADPALQAQLDAALAAVARHGERDRRTLTLRATGQGVRTVRVAYVVEAPLWKATYRLTFDGGATAGLQGWAVLENLTGQDWAGVDLTVVSGNPVTFRQALYDAYYVNRPEVPVEVLGRVSPKLDEGAAPAPQPRAMAAPEAPARKAMTRGLAPTDGLAGGASPGRLAEMAAAESAEATTQVSFHHPGPVSLPNGHSLLLPILNRAVPAERVALFQPSTHPRHPLAAARLTNDGATSLPPGVLTLYERGADGAVAFVGDARLAALPAGQKRVLSFAVDQKVTIDHADGRSQTLSKARVAGGVLQVVTTERIVTTYTITGAPLEPRRVVIEHPRRPGWDLIVPAARTLEATADTYRMSVDVPAGQAVTVAVTAERPRQDRFELVTLSPQQVEFYASARDLPADLREAVAKLATLRAALAEREAAVARLEGEAGALDKDQQRLRDNLQAVGPGSDIGRRYMTKLGEQEDRLETLGKDLAAARAEVEMARVALADHIKGLTF